MIVNTVIFDLDGTLIDSAEAILSSLKAAFDEVGISPIQPLNSELVGPPLKDIITKLLPLSEIRALPNVEAAFKRHYDGTAYVYTQAFDGIPAVLEGLQSMNLKLYVATNKRSIPTKKIISLAGWDLFFSGIYSLDTFNPILPNKSQLLANMLHSLNISSKETVYIGDRTEDYDAAKHVGCSFVLAEWGYMNNYDRSSGAIRVNNPNSLLDILVQNFF
jgi:phosphoglycolate phosphatase